MSVAEWLKSPTSNHVPLTSVGLILHRCHHFIREEAAQMAYETLVVLCMSVHAQKSSTLAFEIFLHQ